MSFVKINLNLDFKTKYEFKKFNRGKKYKIMFILVRNNQIY